MDSTDENTFIIKFNLLKSKTKNFSKINAEIFLEDQTFIGLFRTVCGMTINLFAKELETPYSWIYNLEKNKNKIGPKAAENIAKKISKLFEKNKSSYDLKDILRNFYSLNSINKSDIKKDLDNLINMSFQDFSLFIEKLRSLSYNFTHISNILLDDSRVILIFRIILGLTQKKFAEELNIGKMTIEELENGYRKLTFPNTAKNYALKIEGLGIQNVNVSKLEENWNSWKNTRKSFENKEYNWKTIRFMNSKDFEKYLKEIRKETNNFELICPEMFQKSPQLILIFRIILGITQRELERKLGLNGRYISNYESLKYKNLSKGKAELFSKFFEKEFKFGGLNKLSDEELINRFLQVKNSMFVHDNSASFVVNAKPTKQELEVLNVLNNIKTKNMEILLHENLNTNKGKINVDFVIKINNEPKIVIECTQTQSISKKFSYNLNKKIFEIDYRFVKLKTNYPDIRTVLVLAIYEDDLAKYKLQNLVKNNTLAIDDTFINKNLASLPKLILEENGTKTAKT